MAAFPSWATGKALVKQYTYQLVLSMEPRCPCSWYLEEKEIFRTASFQMLQGKQRLDSTQLLTLVL